MEKLGIGKRKLISKDERIDLRIGYMKNVNVKIRQPAAFHPPDPILSGLRLGAGG